MPDLTDSEVRSLSRILFWKLGERSLWPTYQRASTGVVLCGHDERLESINDATGVDVGDELGELGGIDVGRL